MNEENINKLTAAIEANPDDAKTYFSRGLFYSMEQEYAKAIADYSKAIELNPDFTNAYYVRGSFYSMEQEYAKAIKDYSKAIELKPDFTDAYYDRGLSYFYLNEYDKAIADYSKAIELNPDFVVAYYFRGLSFHDQKYYDKAIEDYSKAIELKPDFTDAYYDRGCSFHEQKYYDKAIEDYSKAIELNPDFAEAYYDRGFTYFNLNEYDKAIADYSKAIELKPDFTYAYYTRGLSYFNLNEYDKAIEDYNNAIKRNLDYTELWTEKGTALLYLGKEKGDIEDCFVQAFSLSKDILSILTSVDAESRERIIDGHYLDKVLEEDAFFKEKTKGINEEELKKYKDVYLHSIWLISLLHVRKAQEEFVAHYTRKDVVRKMLCDSSKFRLYVANYSNDPKEGITLLDYLFGGNGGNLRSREYGAFAGCFTFNLDCLNQFRLYGKEDNKEGTGVAIVIKDSFFSSDARSSIPKLSMTTDEPSLPLDLSIKEKEEKLTLFRCIYLEPESGIVASVGRREEYIYTNEKEKETAGYYEVALNEILGKVRDGMSKLKQKIEGLDSAIVGQLLLNLRYLTKHVAFKEEQECRIIKIAPLTDANVKPNEN
ncbi:MAG: tetratricopeptide repeat protein, partial [Tannerellaceae bacterium]|nr:tetratricopeptide repeat protein [Tannerellaceae bacterium]